MINSCQQVEPAVLDSQLAVCCVYESAMLRRAAEHL
jgi:hypothetical protein